jgi:hypothetical protein
VPNTPAAPAPKDADTPTVGKGRATPTRAEQEAARKRPLVADTKEAKARNKAELAAQRDRARAGMAAGDDKYLPPKDKGPQRRFVRDYVDSRWHIGEFIMPLVLVFVIATFVNIQAIQVYSLFVLWGFVVVVIAEMIITSTLVKRAAARKFGDKRERGLGWYGAMRSIQMRWMRLPKPQNRRGQRPA